MDLTVRLAMSWVGLFTAYVVALILALTKFKELTKGLDDMGIPRWLGVALIAAFPLLAFVFSTIPAFIEQRRIQRYSEITGALQTGYFTLRPRENEEGFERADNAHQEILRWIENTREPVLYLTGASGTGKSSLLSAWAIPKLKREKHVVVQLRGYEEDLLARIKDKLLEPGAIWDKPPAKTDDLPLLLNRATQRLGDRRLLIVVDQFEEFLILTDQERQRAFQQFLSEKPIGGLTFLLVFRPEYEGLIQDQPWPKLQLDTNRKVISPFTENAAHECMRKSGLAVNPDLLRAVLREAAEIEQTVGLRLGESDRAIVRPLDQQQETWEISHDFLVPLLDSIVARRTVSLWRRFRPWLPWTATAVMGIAAVAIPLMTSESQNLRGALTRRVGCSGRSKAS